MKPKLILWLALVLSILSAGNVVAQPGGGTTYLSVEAAGLGLASQDGQVIDAALKAIFEKSDWNTLWTNGSFVVIQTNRSGDQPPRSNFSRSLGDLIQILERGGMGVKGGNHLRALRAIRKSAGPAPDREPPGMSDLRGMNLDPRIVVSGAEFGQDFRVGGATITNRIGKAGTVIAPVLLDPPGYSGTGKYAVLGTHWYKNATDAVFFLESKNGRWRVIHVLPFGYL